MRTNERLDYVDGMRALCALFVVCCHAYSQIYPVNAVLHGLPRLLTGPLRIGHYAVAVFIVISGYCLMLPIVRGDGRLRGGAARFFRKRARRILPPYYLALALSLALIWLCIGAPDGSIWNQSVPVTWPGLWSHLLLYQDVVARGQINYPLWSIAVEWQIYFFFPLMTVGWRRLGPLATTALFLLAGYGVYFLCKPDPAWSGLTAQFLGLFALGALAATVTHSPRPPWSRVRAWPAWTTLAGLLWLPLLAADYVWGWDRVAPVVGEAELLVGLWAISLLICASRAPRGLANRVLGWRPLVAIGAFSYSIYLIHAPLLQLLCRYALFPFYGYLQAFPTFVLLVLLGLPAIVAVSYQFYRFCERPFLNSKPVATAPRSATAIKAARIIQDPPGEAV